LYYGKSTFEESFATVKKSHVLPAAVKPAKPIDYPELDMTESVVYFVDYDMVQTQLLMLSKTKIWEPSLLPSIELFNAYFGSGLSSIVFQEIRESKALAYSAYASMTTPYRTDKSHYIQGSIGTQVNKLEQAVSALQELMNNMPKAEIQFNESKIAALKLIESERIIKTNIYWQYRTLQRAGLNYDVRKDIYTRIQNMQLSDLEKFFMDHIKGRKFTYCVIGNKAEMDMEALSRLGTVKELSLEELFGF
jgi:predicted Zn-dependent peptidase